MNCDWQLGLAGGRGVGRNGKVGKIERWEARMLAWTGRGGTRR